MKKRLVFIATLISIIPTLILTVYFLVYTGNLLKRNITTEITKDVELTTESLYEFIGERYNNLLIWRQLSIPKVALDFKRPEGLIKYLNSLKTQSDVYDYIVVLDETYQYFAINVDKQNGHTMTMDQLVKLLPEYQNTAKELNRINNPGIVKLLLNGEAETKGLFIASKIQNNSNKTLGYFVAHINFDRLQKQFKQINERLKRFNFKTLKVGLKQNPKIVSDQTNFNFCHSSQKSDVSFYGTKPALCLSIDKKELNINWYRYALIIITCILLVAFLFALIFRRTVDATIKPLNNFLCHLKKVAKGEFTKLKLGVEYPEIKSLEASANKIIEQLSSYSTKIAEQSKLVAMGQTTSMLAHDVRKPLSQMRVILDAFDMFKNNPSRLETARNDVKKAITNVESMLAEVMDYSRETKLETSAKSLGGVFDFVIRQVIQGYSDLDITFEYDFRAGRKPLLDEDRFSRVLANIIGNGIEAITVIGKKSSGTVDISTRNISGNHPCTEIIIGNDGPPFPKGVENKLFESFYTDGKSKGTGLGLASAKKIVTLHDGEILARNKEGGQGVEFVIRLPISEELEEIDEDLLPQHSDDIFLPKEDLSALDVLINKMDGKTFKVVLLEDEGLYRAWVKNLIQANEQLQRSVLLYDATNVEEALEIVEKEHPQFAIVDIDLGAEKNGFTFLQAMKKNSSIKSIVHSNRTLDEFKQKAEAMGAINFIPKPLPLSSLVEFLGGEKIVNFAVNRKSAVKRVYACDDTELMRYCLEDLFKKYLESKPNAFDFEIFKNGEELISAAKKNWPNLVFTDLNMREAGGKLSGYEVIKSIKSISKRVKAYLISNEPLALSEEPTKEAGGDGALEQPLNKDLIFPLLDKLVGNKKT